jgi:hypothetical protein
VFASYGFSGSNSFIDTAFIWNLKVSGNELYCQDIPYYGGNIWLSLDSAQTWRKLTTDLCGDTCNKGYKKEIKDYNIANDTIFVCKYDGVYKSSIFNEAWIKINIEIEDSNLSKLFLYKKYLFISTTNKFYRYDITNHEFLALKNGLPVLPDSLPFYNPYASSFTSIDTAIFATIRSGIYKSIDSGITWNKIKVAGNANIIKSSGDNLIVSTLSGEIHRSPDRGITWEKVREGCGFCSMPMIFSLGYFNNIAFVGLYPGMGVNNSLIISEDFGKTWGQANFNISRHIYSFEKLGDKYFAATDSGLFISNDNGNHWKPVYEFYSISVEGYDINNKKAPKFLHGESIQLNIYDIKGCILKRIKLKWQGFSSLKCKLNGLNFSNGLYLFCISSQNNKEIKKVIKFNSCMIF